ncbi:MAG: amino acid adenylation domain-containing protein, partial [Kangiellaceae bacterium]|nr:amino acid adenylation domain-containing protein [Kangiellaceae bacterium]
MLGLLQRAQDSDISLWVEGDDIELSYGEDAPDELFIDSLRQKKSALLDYLNEKQIFSEEAFEQFLTTESAASGFEEFKNNSIMQEQGTNSVEAIFPATSLQQGFVYHYLSQPQDDAYRVQLLLDYHHELNIKLYQKAWRMASQSFPILRTAFDWDGEGDILQVISSAPSIDESKFSYQDLSGLDEVQQQQKLQQILQRDRLQGFDLSQPGMLRFIIIKLDTALYTVLKTEHHIISDGWSSAILLQRVHQYYADLVDGNQPKLNVETAYLKAQAYYAKQADKINTYWSEAQKRFDDPNDLNPLLSNHCELNQVRTLERATETVKSIQGQSYLRLKETCRKLGVTVSVAIQFAWHKLINLYTQDEKTTVGTTVSGRDIPVDGIEASVGLYINTLPLVIDWGQCETVEQVLLQIHRLSADLNSYSNVPLASLQQDGERLFHSLFVFENFPMAEETIGSNATQSDQNLVSFRQSVGKVDYPLSLTVYDQNDSLLMKLEYGEEWLSSNKAEKLLNQVAKIIDTATKNPQQLHRKISPLDEEEYYKQTKLWNQTQLSVASDTCVHQLLENQAEDTPEAIALRFEGREFSYREINSQANRLAHLIRKKLGVQSFEDKQSTSEQKSTQVENILIGLYLQPGLEMIISMLAVLKSGAAYVPISPDFPAQRSSFILEDTRANLVITQQALLPTLKELLVDSDYSPQLLSADNEEIKTLLKNESDNNLSIAVNSEQLAYVIYTSGTTGKPKGVMVEHRNVINFLAGMDNKLVPPEQLITLGVTSIVFDIFVLELYLTLMKGGTLVLASEEQRQSPSKLVSLIQTSRATLVQLTPSRLQLLLSEARAEQVFADVDLLLVGGEAFPQQYLPQLQAVSNLRLFNVYGPTETTVWSSAKSLNDVERVNLGEPIANTQVYVLDKEQQVLPIGCRGELYIGGLGVTRGYLNRPELTTERFIENPFFEEQDKIQGTNRLYRTGYIVRWLSNGELEYLGRSDFQVKIRGHRIELGEIEHAIGRLENVKQTVVINKEREGNQYLVAYIVPVSEERFEPDELINDLAVVLPDYMVPDSFMQLDALPITINGKLDRKKLPEPEFGSRLPYEAPRTDFEEKLCLVWQQILGVEKVGISDNFFRIGGNSILAIQLTAAIRNNLNVDIPLAILLEQKTVKGVADKYQDVDLIPKTKLSPYPLSFAQERMLFFERFDQGSSAYHIP